MGLFKKKSRVEKFSVVLDQDYSTYYEKGEKKWLKDLDKVFKDMKKNGVPDELKDFLAYRYPFHCWEYDLKEMEDVIFQTKHMVVHTLIPGEIPQKIRNLTQLEILEITGSSLTTLPQEIEHLKKLQVLNLGNNLIKVFPKVILELTNLYELILTNNYLNNIPKDIETLKKLKILQLNNNQLTEFPIEILSLTELKKLGLMYNEISTIPPSIINLQYLEELILANNPIYTIPFNTSQLSHLKWLLLGDTNIPENHKNEIKAWLPDTKITF